MSVEPEALFVDDVESLRYQYLHRKPRILPRSFWKAAANKWSWKLHLPVPYVFKTYTMTDPCYLKSNCIKELQYLQKYFMRNGSCPDIRYSFLVGGDGTVYEGRGWKDRPGLPPRFRMMNRRSIFIGFIGTFNLDPPSEKMQNAYTELISCGIKQGFINWKHLEFSI